MRIAYWIIKAVNKSMQALGQVIDIFCRASLYATAGLCGVIAIQYYFIVKSLPIHKQDLKADITANIIAFWQAEGVELSVTQMYGIAVFIWASLAVVLMILYLGDILTTSIRLKIEFEE